MLPPLPTRICFCELRLDEDGRGDALRRELLDLDRDRVRYLLARQGERLLADSSAIRSSSGSVGQLAVREVQRALGEERRELVAQRRDPVAGQGADRMERVEVAELRRDRDLRCDLRGSPPIDLVEGDHDGQVAPEDARRRRSGRRRRSPRRPRGRSSTASTSSSERSTRPCMRSVSAIPRALEAREVDQHELVAVTVRDPCTRCRVVCGLSETIATLPPQSALTSVDLPTFGRPASATKPLLTDRSRTPGQELCRGVAASARPSGRVHDPADAGTRASHWRHAPHGETRSPQPLSPLRGRRPRRRAGERRALGTEREPVGGVLDVRTREDAPVAREHAPRRRRGRSTGAYACAAALAGEREELRVVHRLSERLEEHERDGRLRGPPPRPTSTVEWMPDSTRVWATSRARTNAIADTSARWP